MPVRVILLEFDNGDKAVYVLKNDRSYEILTGEEQHDNATENVESVAGNLARILEVTLECVTLPDTVTYDDSFANGLKWYLDNQDRRHAVPALTERQRIIVRQALLYAQANIDDLNDSLAFDNEDDESTGLTVDGQQIPQFDGNEFQPILALLTASQ